MRVREPRRLSVILIPEGVARLLDAAPGLKAKSALNRDHSLRTAADDHAPRTNYLDKAKSP